MVRRSTYTCSTQRRARGRRARWGCHGLGAHCCRLLLLRGTHHSQLGCGLSDRSYKGRAVIARELAVVEDLIFETSKLFHNLTALGLSFGVLELVD